MLIFPSDCRYAFIRYNSIDESISAYKQAHNLMWDTRSIIVRFRRQRGNTCLPGEPKPNVKKVKEEPNNSAQAKEQKANHVELKANVKKLKEELSNLGQVKKEDKVNHASAKAPLIGQDADAESRLQDNSDKAQSKPASQDQEQKTNSHSAAVPTSTASAKTVQQEQQQQLWVYTYEINMSLSCDALTEIAFH